MSASKRDELVREALKVFYRDGFGATGMDKLVKETGVSKTSMYKHFRSKDELMDMLRQRRAGATQSDAESDGAEGLIGSQSTVKHEAPGLAADSSFWNSKEPMDDFRAEINSPEVEVAVLRRLGKPSFWRSRKQFSRLFQSTYNTASDSVRSLIT